jgi:hypothetical protein
MHKASRKVFLIVIASAATDEDAPPEPAKAYFAGFTARLKPRPFKTTFKTRFFRSLLGCRGFWQPSINSEGNNQLDKRWVAGIFN